MLDATFREARFPWQLCELLGRWRVDRVPVAGAHQLVFANSYDATDPVPAVAKAILDHRLLCFEHRVDRAGGFACP